MPVAVCAQEIHLKCIFFCRGFRTRVHLLAARLTNRRIENWWRRDAGERRLKTEDRRTETGEAPPATVSCVCSLWILKYSLNLIKRSMAASRSDVDVPADSRRAVGHAHLETPILTLFTFCIYSNSTSSNFLFILDFLRRLQVSI